jgi:S1-C subfamily serine protease
MVVKPFRFPSACVANFSLPMRPQNFWTKPGFLTATLLSLWAYNLTAQTLLTALEQDMRQLVQVAKPSVVTIMAATANVKKEGGGLFGLFRGRESNTPEVKVGSGLIVSSDGFIVTKESVVRESGQIEIVLADGQSLRAELVALDSLSNVAVLKVNGDKLAPARISAAESVQAGSWVAVIGNALGMPQAVSVGVVSAVHESGVIQISANVDPGSNGSPIFNAEGRAVGIVSGRMGLGPDGNIPENFFSCTALVYPLALCLPRLREIVRRYYETRGWLGVRVVADAKDQRLPKVLSVVKDSPAERVGMQVGDVITHFTGQPIESFQMLPEMVAACRPGASENLRVVRGDSVINFNIQIGQQTPAALAELQPAPETIADLDDSKPSIQEKFKLENLRIHRRIQALEKELQYLRSLQQKP